MLKLSYAIYLSISGETKLSIFCCILHLVREILNLKNPILVFEMKLVKKLIEPIFVCSVI
jgi:hypothetical protein